ncbi:MAG: hypothetical protein HC924_17470 [Synechococcaceae cyanobacterium SM2_3_2]|nr:hypothetical protein [Synechococcaceae cyanobacterium SM2_3_2]
MKISGDKATSLLGLVGAALFAQQVWLPELLPTEVAGSIGAALVAAGGAAANKDEIEIGEDGKKRKRLCELEAEIAALEAELEKSLHQGYPEPGGDDEPGSV